LRIGRRACDLAHPLDELRGGREGLAAQEPETVVDQDRHRLAIGNDVMDTQAQLPVPVLRPQDGPKKPPWLEQGLVRRIVLEPGSIVRIDLEPGPCVLLDEARSENAVMLDQAIDG